MVDGAAQSAVEFAAQTGRLDFLTALLAVVAIGLGLSTFPLFFFLTQRAEKVARDEATAALEGAAERIEKLAIERLEQMLPTLVEDYMRLVENAASDDEANRIAAIQDEDVKSR